MKILAVDSSAKSASVAVAENGRLISECFVNNALTHSRTLMPMVENALSQADMSLKDINALCVNVGPGSFTGIRIGVAAVKGLAACDEIPCAGVSTLESIAYNFADEECIVCAAMDARRDQVYTACFAMENVVFRRLTEDRAISIQELQRTLSEFERNIYLVGDGAALCYSAMSADITGLKLLPEHMRMQRAAGTALLAWEKVQNGQIIPAGDVQPNYLRLSQAERKRQKKLAME